MLESTSPADVPESTLRSELTKRPSRVILKTTYEYAAFRRAEMKNSTERTMVA